MVSCQRIPYFEEETIRVDVKLSTWIPISMQGFFCKVTWSTISKQADASISKHPGCNDIICGCQLCMQLGHLVNKHSENPIQHNQGFARSYPSVIFSLICFLLCAICCLLHGSCNMICSVWRLLLLFFFGLCILAVNCYLCFYFPTMLKRTITFTQRRMLGAWNTNGPPSLLCLASREGTPSAASASIVWSLENVCKMTWKSYRVYWIHMYTVYIHILYTYLHVYHTSSNPP